MQPGQEIVHKAVLPAETLHWLAPQPGSVWVDCTLGGGGHAKMIADAMGPHGKLIGLDQDAGMIERAKTRLAGLPVSLIHANFDQLTNVLAGQKVNGVLADLGIASDQLDDPLRGFSFQKDGALDMRLNPQASSTAAEIVNTADEAELARIFWEYGEERHSRRIARRISERRSERPFETTNDLAMLIAKAVPNSPDSRRIHPATRCFQALRIAVNDELAALESLLAQLPGVLVDGGVAGIISFHSLEDRRVKLAFRDSPEWEILTKKPVEAGDPERAANPRSRSAKLRVARRRPRGEFKDERNRQTGI